MRTAPGTRGYSDAAGKADEPSTAAPSPLEVFSIRGPALAWGNIQRFAQAGRQELERLAELLNKAYGIGRLHGSEGIRFGGVASPGSDHGKKLRKAV